VLRFDWCVGFGSICGWDEVCDEDGMEGEGRGFIWAELCVNYRLV
jgi:hypothetical protein